MSFWTRYVLLKEQQGQAREVTLGQIEQRFGVEERQKIETELGA